MLIIFIVSLIYYMHIIGLSGLCRLHFINKTFRELILLPFSCDYFILILIMYKLIKHKNVGNHIKGQRLSWFGHVQRMPDTRRVKKIFKWNPLTQRSQGRPKYRWEDSVKQDICQIEVTTDYTASLGIDKLIFQSNNFVEL